VIALGEQHLQQGLALLVQLVGVAFDRFALGGMQRAGGTGPAFDLHCAHAAGALRIEVRVPAQVRDVAPRASCSVQDGFAGRERHVDPVQRERGGR